MGNKNISKIISFGTVAVLVVMMMAATIIEKVVSTESAFSMVYHSPVFILLWIIAVISGLVWLWKAGVPKRPLILALHLSFVVILAGALTSHLTSSSGVLRLRVGQSADRFECEDGRTELLPFSITLSDFEVQNYLGTTSAMDYVSEVTIDGQKYTISMNNILKKGGYRFYQSSYDEDEMGSIFSVSHDPWGVTISYIGYILLFLCLFGFFFCPDTAFRKALSRVTKGGVAAIILLFVGLSNVNAQTSQSLSSQEETPFRDAVKEGSILTPKALPKDLADSLCNLYVYYGGRMAPLQTLARDYVMKVYGKPKAMDFSAEEVFSGWLFWFDTWKNVPIKLKAKEKGTSKEDEKYYAMQSVASLRAVKIFPYKSSEGNIVWLSSSDKLPSEMDSDQWMFIRKVFSLISEEISDGDYDGAREIISKIGKYQKKVAGDVLPSQKKFNAEKTYNRISRPMVPAMICVTLGMVLFILTGVMISRKKTLSLTPRALIAVFTAILAIYITVILGLRWYISGHVPMAGGFEMMLLIAWVALIMSTVVFRRLPIFQPLGLLLTGFALLVAVLGESNPQISPLMPVLSSPLLSIHVACMMISYTMLGLAALNGIMGVIVSDKAAKQNLADVALVILYPGIFLLFIGTFLGAIWANVSWGSYWMWDPKETWALVTCIVYAAAFHKGSLGAFRNPTFFHWFCIIAFMCVIITYFGVNFILGGMHSYA